ncbi:hypothetical protein [Nocardioides sp.]|uniref:hypothetical protein n=1 Tax=Nocardioides sp. TaxID=35761 RepID=UPI00286E4210|nr:hypothetical protein [Nocardioides sp.]
MSIPRLLPALSPFVGGVLTAVLLSGCAGSASPGVAARVGDETISASRVDEATGHMCTALSDQFKGAGRVVPLGVIRQGVVQLLALASEAEQIAAEYGVTPSTTYERDVAERTRAAAVMPEEVRADYIEVMSTQALAGDVLDQVGRAKLAAEGFAEPTVDQVTQAGSDVFKVWPDANGIDVDPKYGVELTDGQLTPTDTNLSFAASDQAKAGLAAEPDAAYVDSLPSSQRCGD